MAAESHHVLEETVPASPEVVRAFYVDLENLMSLHPFLVGVHSQGRVAVAGGYREAYRIDDRIPFGPLRLPIRYAAELEVREQGEVISDARQFPNVRLHSVMTFEPTHDGGTRMVERLRISAPRPLAGFTVRQAVSAHAEMLAGIRAHFADR